MDELLIKKAKRGDTKSFSQIIMQVKDHAYRIAFCYLKNEEDSMDAVSDAVEKAFINLRKLKQPQYFKTWFIRIVINECKLQLRGKEKVTALADHLYLNKDQLESREEKLDLQCCLIELPALERVMIYLKYYMGYTLDEIAEMMDISSGTVRTKIYGSLKILKSKLEAREV